MRTKINFLSDPNSKEYVFVKNLIFKYGISISTNKIKEILMENNFYCPGDTTLKKAIKVLKETMVREKNEFEIKEINMPIISAKYYCQFYRDMGSFVENIDTKRSNNGVFVKCEENCDIFTKCFGYFYINSSVSNKKKYYECKKCKQLSKSNVVKKISTLDIQKNVYTEHNINCVPVRLIDVVREACIKKFCKSMDGFDAVARIQYHKYMEMFADFLSKNNLTGTDFWVEFDLIKDFASFGEYLRVRKFRLDNDIIIDGSIISFAGENIVLHYQPNNTVIFATQSSLRILSNSNTWIADGTFKSSATGYTQLYSISGITNEENGKCCVAVWILLKGKSEKVYTESFGIIKNYLVTYFGRESIIDKNVVLDKEFSATRSFLSVFDGISINYCLFHYKMCIIRRIKSLTKLRKCYFSKKKSSRRIESYNLRKMREPTIIASLEIKYYLKLYLGLPFLPEGLFQEGV